MSAKNKTAQLWECTAAEYHADKEWLSRSSFLEFVEDPALFAGRHLTGIIPPRESTGAMSLGTAFHDMVSDGSFKVNARTFGVKTIAVWKAIKSVPKAAMPLPYETQNGQFWSTNEGVYRKAKVWGQLDACQWTLDVDPPRGKQALAFCAWQDFLPTSKFTPIPQHVLNDKGERKGLPWDVFKSKHPGELMLKAAEYAALPKMLAALRACEGARTIVESSRRDESQNTVVWVDRATGIKRKARIDLWPIDFDRVLWIADLKSSSATSLREFAYSVIRFGYDVQAVWYCDAVEALTGKRPRFFFVVCRSDAPYTTYTLELAEDFERRGRRIIDNGLAAMAECRRTGIWLSRSHDKILTLPMPPSAKNDESWEVELELEEQEHDSR